MKLSEIKVRGVYVARLSCAFRNEKDIQEITLLLSVVGKTSSLVEVVLLNDPHRAVYYLEPSQLETV